MAIYADLYADQGSYFSTVVNVGSLGAFEVDLTGYAVRGKIRKSYSSFNSVDFTAAVIDAAAGQIEISLESDVTAAMKPGRYLYDVEIVNTISSRVQRIVEGQFEVMPGVTSALPPNTTLDGGFY